MGRNWPESRASTNCGSVRIVGLELGNGASDVAGQVGVAAGGAKIVHALAEGLGPLVFFGFAAGVDPLDDGNVVERLALLHVLHQADAEAAGMGGNDIGRRDGGRP